MGISQSHLVRENWSDGSRAGAKICMKLSWQVTGRTDGRTARLGHKAVVGGTAGPAMAVPLFSRACNNIVL